MPVKAEQLLFKYATASAGGHSAAQNDPANSLGKYASTTEWEGEANDLFGDVHDHQNMNASADTEYRCLFVYNSNQESPLLTAKVWLESAPSPGDTIAIGVDPNAPSPVESSTPQALEVGDQYTAPTGVTFFIPNSDRPVVIGNIQPGHVKAIWIRRTVSNVESIEEDGFTIGLSGRTY